MRASTLGVEKQIRAGGSEARRPGKRCTTGRTTKIVFT
jgi:hypothetical protein